MLIFAHQLVQLPGSINGGFMDIPAAICELRLSEKLFIGRAQIFDEMVNTEDYAIALGTKSRNRCYLNNSFYS